MAPSLSTRNGDSLGTHASDSAVDHALSLLLADETEAALRWGAAALEHDPFTPGAILVTSRLLNQVGRSRAAADGLLLAMHRAVDVGDLPLAMVAIDHLRMLGMGVTEQLEEVARAFCHDSPRLQPGQLPPPRPDILDFQPLSPLLTGSSLASKATQILLAAKHTDDDLGADLRALTPVPLFSALPKDALRDLLEALETTIVPAGHRLIQERKDSGAAYIVASGNLEISRRPADANGKPRTVLGHAGTGALVGEISLLSRLPSPATVTATCASILLVAKRQAIEPVAARHPEIAFELAAHCRRHAVANLGWASTVISAVPAQECAALVERLEARTFEKGEKLVAYGEESHGLHLIVAGEVAVVGREGDGRVMLGTRLPGDTVGEVELVLCQKANVDAIAVRDTATLLLPHEEFFGLVRESPATLHGLYAIAVRRHTETRLALESGSAAGVDEWAFEEPGDDDAVADEPAPRGSSISSAAELTARREPTSRPPPLPPESGNAATGTPQPVHTAVPPVHGGAPTAWSRPPLASPPLRSPSFRSAPPAVPISTSVAPAPPRTRPWLTRREVALVAVVASLVFVLVSMLGRSADPVRTSASAALGNTVETHSIEAAKAAPTEAAKAAPTEAAKAAPTAVAAPSPPSTPSTTSAAEIVATAQVLAPIVMTAPKLVSARRSSARVGGAAPASVVSDAASTETATGGAPSAARGAKPGAMQSQSKTPSAASIGAAPDEFGGRQ
jgi:CRP-like cAMP-binding protein